MTRTMYDGITPSELPADATMVAGYMDGLYANMPAMAARYPSAVRVGIAVFAHTDDGVVLDVETGDATPGQAPGWVVMRRGHGVDPTVYCNTDTWPAVRQAFTAAGVPEPHYWVAQYDGVPTIPAGAVAKQYQSTDPWDVSVVADYWPGVDPLPPAPAPAPPAVPQGDDTVAINHIPAGFAFDAAGNLTDRSKAVLIPLPTVGDDRWRYSMVDLSFGCDFGDATLRVAVHNRATGWRVQTLDVTSTGPRVNVWLEADDDKASVGRVPVNAKDTASDVPVSWLVETAQHA